MPGLQLWLWDATNGKWIKAQCDASGNLKVDLSNINLGDLGDVSVASPSDNDLLYYDDATGRWKARALVDADIPAAIARDTEVTAAIATHAALPTVHQDAPTLIAAHAAIAAAHHARYTDAEASAVAAALDALLTFLGLTDAPSSYSGQGGKVVKVNSGETALEFGADVGAWDPVTEVDVSTNTTTITITGLDLDTDRLYDLYLALDNPLGSTVNYWIYFNNDTTNTNYYIRNLKGYWTGAADAVVSLRFNAPYAFSLAANKHGASNLVVARETTTGNPVWQMRGGVRASTSRANGLDILYYAGRWNTSANVTRIDITASVANGIGAGSKLTLFKVA